MRTDTPLLTTTAEATIATTAEVTTNTDCREQQSTTLATFTPVTTFRGKGASYPAATDLAADICCHEDSAKHQTAKTVVTLVTHRTEDHADSCTEQLHTILIIPHYTCFRHRV